MASVSPIYGWGYLDEIDGELAPTFEVVVQTSGVNVGGGIRGWRGTVSTGKYLGSVIEMTPRHVEWDGLVVANVQRDGKLIFSGMADTAGLECNWK